MGGGSGFGASGLGFCVWGGARFRVLGSRVSGMVGFRLLCSWRLFFWLVAGLMMIQGLRGVGFRAIRPERSLMGKVKV